MDRGATHKGNCIYRLPFMNNIKNNVKFFKKKVVHLVRDPRASISSMMHEKSTWTSKLANFKDDCKLYYEDLSMEKSMPSSK